MSALAGAFVECEGPNKKLYDFAGSLTLKGKEASPLSTAQVSLLFKKNLPPSPDLVERQPADEHRVCHRSCCLLGAAGVVPSKHRNSQFRGNF